MNRPSQPEPLAYFLTWPTYGTLLPGDERGWVKRRRGHQPANRLKRHTMATMTDDACRLDEDERRLKWGLILPPGLKRTRYPNGPLAGALG